MTDEEKTNVDNSTDDGTTTSGNATNVQVAAEDNTSKQATSPSQKGEDWETAYKGLQKVVARKDREVNELTDKLENLSSQLEELKTTSQSSQSAKSDLEKQLGELQSTLESLKTEKDDLNNKLAQSSLVMEKFPEIAPLAAFIPSGNSIEEFEQNAQAFKERIDDYTSAKAKGLLQGASPTSTKSSEDGMVTENELDKLWDQVYSLAGIPGKEKEYEEANSKLQSIIASQSN